MKIIQTFWSSGRNPLEHSFGWPHAEYNLMSWTLSCLSLREHFDQVELYTDKRGYEVLIEKLHLPYTQVHVIYDDNLCLPQHWAYAKIKTYSLQTEPFLHIDGDMYFPKPIPQEILGAGLVAQNREIGTSYYQGMMNRVLAHPEFKLPQFIQETLDNGTIASYNMGIFGGNDIDFIRRYCQEVFAFFEANHMNDASVEYSNEECNVFFEQIFLAAMVDKEKKEVKGVLPHPVMDNGYFYKDICYLKEYDTNLFCHVLGGLKRDFNICRLLAKKTLALHSSYYWNIRNCFHHQRSNYIILDKETTEIHRYKSFVWNHIIKWSCIDNEAIKAEEELAAKGLNFTSRFDTRELDFHIKKATYMSIFEVNENISNDDTNLLRARFSCPDYAQLKYIAITHLSHKIGYNEIRLTKDEHLIISTLGEKEMSIRELIFDVMQKEVLPINNHAIRKRLLNFYYEEIARLIDYGILLATENKFV